MEITIQPVGVIITGMITGVFAGISFGFGSLIVKYYFEPKFKSWKKKHDKFSIGVKEFFDVRKK